MNYYRNNKAVLSLQGVEIEEGSLWERKNELMVLVDDDQYITVAFDKETFIPSED